MEQTTRESLISKLKAALQFEETMVQAARTIANIVHQGQFRRDGTTPYIKHVEDVVLGLEWPTPHTVAAAWLHDVLEDSPLTRLDLLEILDAKYAERLLPIVCCLGRGDRETYEDYIKRVCKMNDAVIVKRSDINANLNDDPTPAQREKYTKALKLIDEYSNPADFIVTIPAVLKYDPIEAHVYTFAYYAPTWREALAAAEAEMEKTRTEWEEHWEVSFGHAQVQKLKDLPGDQNPFG